MYMLCVDMVLGVLATILLMQQLRVHFSELSDQRSGRCRYISVLFELVVG